LYGSHGNELAFFVEDAGIRSRSGTRDLVSVSDPDFIGI
jgi:hypothetical protein